MRVNGLHAPITIRRDSYAIPYIDARNEDDAWFGLGFCQAQDRAFQLELRLRTQRGALSELFGEQTLGIDRLSRRIGFVEASQRQLPRLDDDVRSQIEAFVRGINAGLAAGAERVAPEFALLRSRPSEWRATDVLGMGKLLSFLLIGNWDVELARLKLLLSDGPEALRDLDPTPYPEDHVVAAAPGARAGAALDRLSQDVERFLAFAGAGGGSNAWAVAGSRTSSGRPILANDPHLEATLPPHWYLVHLRTPGWALAGASMIGAPAIGAGHNGVAAWGVTASLVDTTDLFLEEVGPDGRTVRRGETYETCDVRRELISVRGKAPVVEDVLVTPRGPVIGPALSDDLGAISLRAVWLDAKPARGFLRLHHVRSFEAFRREFEHWPVLSQSVVYADASGTIAWQIAGKTPVRRAGWGTLPQHAADPETGWLDESVPPRELPFVVDPPSGFVATANNKPAVDDESGAYLGVDWLDGYRAGRIAELLGARHDWDPAATLAMQMDEKTLAWREVQDIILALPAETQDLRLVLDHLHDWDGSVSAGSSAASIFELFLREVSRRIARARAPKAAAWALGRGFNELLPGTTFAAGRSSRVLRRLREQPEGWFERGWQNEMTGALSAVLRDLRRAYGPEPSSWAWGNIRPLTLQHPLGRVKALAPIFNRGPFPWGGDGNTISQAGGAPASVIAPVVASLRVVVPVGDWESARFVLPGGQSGNPFSKHYDDMLPLWQQGGGVPIAWSAESVSRAAVEMLELRPL